MTQESDGLVVKSYMEFYNITNDGVTIKMTIINDANEVNAADILFATEKAAEVLGYSVPFKQAMLDTNTFIIRLGEMNENGSLSGTGRN